jgi:hypothetical protein
MIEHQLWLGRRAAVVALHMVGERLRPPALATAADVPRNGTDLNVDWQRGAPAAAHLRGAHHGGPCTPRMRGGEGHRRKS